MRKLKFVYALTSGASDYYAEQALISMHSLRMHNPECHITLATDAKTFDSLCGNRALIKDYVSESVVIHTPEDFNPVQRSRFVKTSLRQHVEGDFLYLDCDTVILGNLEELENFDGDAAATPYMHIRYRTPGTVPEILKKYHNLVNVDPGQYDYSFFCNGGVIFCRDNEAGHLLFDLWHKFWLEGSVKYGYHSDQCSLWRANAAAGNVLRELNGIYNCQIIYSRVVLEYICDCKVLHYQSTSNTFSECIPFKDDAFLAKIRRDGITPEVEDVINNMMRDYMRSVIIVGGRDLAIYDSSVVVMARKLSRDCPWTNKVAKFIYGLFGHGL